MIKFQGAELDFRLLFIMKFFISEERNDVPGRQKTILPVNPSSRKVLRKPCRTVRTQFRFQ